MSICIICVLCSINYAQRNPVYFVIWSPIYLFNKYAAGVGHCLSLPVNYTRPAFLYVCLSDCLSPGVMGRINVWPEQPFPTQNMRMSRHKALSFQSVITCPSILGLTRFTSHHTILYLLNKHNNVTRVKDDSGIVIQSRSQNTLRCTRHAASYCVGHRALCGKLKDSLSRFHKFTGSQRL